MRFISLLALTLGTVLTGCATVPTAPADLQGSWLVVAGEHEGTAMDVVVGGKLDVKDEAFTVRTASGNELKGRVEIAADKSPAEVDFFHANGPHWMGIYEFANGSLRLNYVDAAGKEPRPVQFKTSGETEASLLTLQRSAP